MPLKNSCRLLSFDNLKLNFLTGFYIFSTEYNLIFDFRFKIELKIIKISFECKKIE